MSNNPKPRGTDSGKPEAPLAQLKEVWLRLPDSGRDYWREQLASARKLSEIRAEILTKFKIKLGNDGKLSKFRDWISEQDLRDEEAARQQDEEKQIFSEHPEWTLDQVREEVLRKSYFRSLAQGDFKLGLATSREHTRKQIVALEREKFETLAAEKMLSAAIRAKADEINALNISQADKIAAMRQAAFADVDAFEASGEVELPARKPKTK